MDGMTITVAPITPGEARRMSRWQAIEALRLSGDPEDRHIAELLYAGPSISEEDEARLNDWIPLPMPLTFAVRRALRG